MKYMGSKNKIQAEILPIILEDIDKFEFYIEPFCGGLGTMDKVPDTIKKIANDYNPFLIAMWKGLQMGLDKPMEIPKTLYDEYRNKFNLLKNHYNNVRYVVNEPINKAWDSSIEDKFKEYFLIGWIGYMGSFNGRFYDGGYSGKTATRDYVNEQIKNTLKQVPLLTNIRFTTYDYKELTYPRNSIVYCDIPYSDTKQYSFSKDFDYKKFWNWTFVMKKCGYNIFVSEYKAPDNFKCVWSRTVTNSLNTTKTYKPVEKLFTL